MGQFSSTLAKQRNTTNMEETKNIPVLVTFANSLFASIVFVFWYFAVQMWREEQSKYDENNINTINTEKTNCETENNESLRDEIKSNDDKHIYIKNGENVLKIGYTFCYHQNAENKYTTEDLEINTANKNNVSTEAVAQKPSEQLSGATFHWPGHENTIENLRSFQHETPVSQSLLVKLDCLGIRRDDTNPLEGQDMDSRSVKVCDTARRSGQLANRKHIRITWDNFLAKARPGLEMDKVLSPRPRKYQRKHKNTNQYELVGKQTTNFIRKIKPDNFVNFERVL